MVIVLPEPPEPHAASSAPAPSVASATAARARIVWGTLKLVTAGQTSGSRGAFASAGPRGRASPFVADGTGPLRESGCVRIELDRARRGGSGALNPQSALAGLNSPPRDSAPGRPVAWGVDGSGPARCRLVNQVRSGRK